MIRTRSKQRFLSAATFLLVFVISEHAFAQPSLWTSEMGGNGHWYEVVELQIPLTWSDAEASAESMSWMGAPGHLATLTSQAENSFVTGLLPLTVNVAWIGGFQPIGSPEPLGGWQWITNEAFDFTNWAPGEPNNLGGNEDALQLHGEAASSPIGTWNDGDGSGLDNVFVVEFIPEPTTLSLLLLGGLVAFRRR